MGILPCIYLDGWTVRLDLNCSALCNFNKVPNGSCIQCRNIDMPTRNAHYTPHTHNGLTTHLILDGELTITYPEDENPIKETFGVGSRIDVDAGRVHEVWVGKAGCTYVIGEK